MIGSRDLRPRITRQYFVDDHIDLTGCVAISCTFDGCIVRLLSSNPIPFFIKDCLFIDCQLIGAAWRNAALRQVNRINEPWEGRNPA